MQRTEEVIDEGERSRELRIEEKEDLETEDVIAK